ncbi:MAG TPA: glycosyltransferase [Candidatus Dormibacteraeota bacterium]|nr:glycosyltransferase [Candidatus Dormibacteraeota bacterium]
MPTLALSMIVKNAARDLPECLASVRGVVNEIIVADTGSTDETVTVARETGARVVSLPWENDSSKARNSPLAMVTADWVLSLDADERLDPGASAVLPALLARKDVDGYQVTIRNYVPTLAHKMWNRSAVANDSAYAPARHAAAYVDHENERLFRRDPAIRFSGRVHETVGWSILSVQRKIATANLMIHHMGMLGDPEERARKILFYLELGKQKAAEMPENRQAHFEVGVSLLENLGDNREALAAFERACEVDPRFGLAWFFVGVCQFRLENHRAALASFRRAESCGHFTPWLSEMEGDAQYNLGNFEAAVACYRRSLKRAPAKASIESKLGLAEFREGRERAGLRRMRQAVDEEPGNAELYDRLVVAEAFLKHLPEAAEIAERKLAAVTPRAEVFLRAAALRGKMEQWSEAAELIRRGVAIFPDSESLLNMLSKIETVPTPSNPAVPERVI